jgi:Uncharacterized protein conserved in bacteria
LIPENELRNRAKDRVERKLGFYWHFSSYVGINILLAFVWYFTGYYRGVMPWFIFVVIFWGIGVVAHWIAVFANIGYVDRATEQEYQKLRKK